MGVFIHETATVEKGSVIGDGTKIWHYAHVRKGAVVGKNCNVGHCAYIGTGVKIGDRVKIGNKASVFQGIEIENEAFIGPHVVFTNDNRPRSVGDWKLIKTYVKKGASIGSNSTILCGITLGENCMVGAGSVVTDDVPEHGLVYGNPARLMEFVCSCGGTLKAVRKAGNAVVMVCSECKKTVKIPNSVFDKLEGV